MYNLISQDYLMHHGVKGMKWGVRRAEQKRDKIINKYNRIIKSNLSVGNSRKRDLEDYRKNGKNSIAWRTAQGNEWTNSKEWYKYTQSEMRDNYEVVNRGKKKVKELQSLDLNNRKNRKKLNNYKKTPIWD